MADSPDTDIPEHSSTVIAHLTDVTPTLENIDELTQHHTVDDHSDITTTASSSYLL